MSQHNLINAVTEYRVMRRYHQLSGELPDFDLADNDAAHGGRGAHTIDRHGPDIPLQRDVSTKTIEGRIYGDPPWSTKATRSYKWTDLSTMNRAVNAYVKQNWEILRADLALRQFHEGIFDAGRRLGRGYYNSGMFGAGPRQARYGETSLCMVRVCLVPEPDSAVPFILSAFPWS
jgi:hypothetical protein